MSGVNAAETSGQGRSLRETSGGRGRTRIALAGVTLVVGLAASAAHAQPRDPKRAEELFQAGKKLFEEGSFDAACDKLAESQTLDPAIGTQGLLAACHEKQGKIATAWEEYRAAQAAARKSGDNREAYARERGDALEREVPRLTLQSSEAGLTAKCDARPFPLNTASPIDPGNHECVVSGAGKRPFTTIVAIGRGQKLETRIPALAADGTMTPAISATTTPGSGDGPTPAPDAGSPGSPRRTVAFVAGGVGVAGLVVGSIFGVLAIEKNSDRNDLKAQCDPLGTCKTPENAEKGTAFVDDARAFANVSTVGFVVGGVGIAAAAVLLLTAPSAPATAGVKVMPTFSKGGAGAAVRARF